MMPLKAFSQVCSAVFPDVASSYFAGGTINIATNSTLYDTDTIIDAIITHDTAVNSCDTGPCESSGGQSESLNLASFNYTTSSTDVNTDPGHNYAINQNSYDDILLQSGSTLSFIQNNKATHIDHLTAYNHTSITFAAGEYWIDHLAIDNYSSIEVNGNDTVTLYVNNLTLGQNVTFNALGENSQLVIVAYGDFTFSPNSQMNGYLFVSESVTFTQDNEFFGAFNAKTINVGENVNLYTRVADIDTARFDGMCAQNMTLPDPVHYYSMDMCATPSGNNSINDDIGNNDGGVKGAITLDYDAKYCQGVYLSGIEAFIDIPDPAAIYDLSEGSISFYFKTPDLTHSNNSNAGYMTLFSRDHNGFENGGHLTAWVTDSGALSIRQQSNASTYDIQSVANIVLENQWHHFAYTWGSDGMNLYLDGKLVAQYAAYTGGLNANGRDLAIGANAWSYNSNSGTLRSNQLKDFYKGAIDEFKIFNTQLSNAQVSTLQQLSTQTCTSCSADPILIAHWGADVCSFEQDALIDVQSGINGVIRNGITTSYSSRFCQGLNFDGNQSYATVAHNASLQVSQGAISLWFKLPDLSHSNKADEGGNALLSKDSINYANGDHIELRVDAQGRIQVRHQEIGESKNWHTAPVVVENQWHHLVYSFGPRGAYIYVDGQPAFHNSTYYNGLETNDDTLVFGAGGRHAERGSVASSNFKDYMLGELDHIKLYKNQPSASDISDWYLEQSAECATCNTLVAHYTFDQDNYESATIEDNSGNGNTGLLGGSVNSALLADNIACRAVELPTSSGVGAAYYFDTNITPETIGSQGAISFWYRAKNNWNDGVARQLFDASDDVAEKYFYLVKSESGRLTFGLENVDDNDVQLSTPAQTFAANTWVHISVQWNMLANEFSIYINAQLQTLSGVNDLSSSTLPNLESLVFGDSRSGYVVSPATSNSADGYIDDIRIYAQVISAQQIQADKDSAVFCIVLDHYRIEHPTTAQTCDLPTITVKACANESCSVLTTTPSTLVLTPDKFTPNSSITFTGQAELTLSNQNAGILTIGTSSQDPIASVECSNNCEIDYESTGIQFFNKLNEQTSLTNTWFVAQDSLANVGMRIVGDSGGTCEGIVNGQQDIELTYSCVTKTSVDYTPSQCNVPFAGIALSGTSAQSGTVSMSFDVNGETDLSAYSFADAGILRLQASATINGASVQAASVDLNIVPSYLSLSSTSDSVITAGESIPFSISAYGSSDTLLPGFQSNDLEMSALRLIPNDVIAHDSEFYFNSSNAVTSALSESFENISANFSAGQVQSNSAYFEEVGTYTISVRDNDYLGTQINASPITLGRVIPAYFNVQKEHQPVLQNTCNASFTYVGENFSYVAGLEPSYIITAYNALGQITKNYANDLWLLSFDATALAAQSSWNDTSDYSGALEETTGLSTITVSGTDLFDGIGIITLNGFSYNYEKVNAPTGLSASPFNANFELNLLPVWFTDADDVCYQDSYPNSCSGFNIEDIGGANMRYGRMNIENAFGPETEPLAIPIFTEYLDEGQWRVNKDDSCTPIILQQSSGDIAITHDSQSDVNIASMITNLSVSSQLIAGILPSSELTVGPFTSGSTTVAGSFLIKLIPNNNTSNWSQYLNYDWDGDGDVDADDTPSASINLGIYRGNERTLHWREVLN